MSEFPKYRKLINNKSYYRIEDESHFIEIQLIGNKEFELKINAVQFPEKLKIKDMLNCEDPYIKIEQNEFDQINERLKNN